jgi:PAS domain S-box-containing protein
MLHQTLLGDAWEHAEVALAVFSDDGRYIACNAAFCALTGFSRDEIIQMRVGVDLAPEDTSNVGLFRDIVTGRAHTGTGDLRRKDGTVVTVDVVAIATHVASLPYFVVVYWEQASRPLWPGG